MNLAPKDSVGRLFAAADLILAILSSKRGVATPLAQLPLLDEASRVTHPGLTAFTRAELLEARAMLLRLGFGRSAA
jgi:hypothetical protein